jgi:hypothetical protein
MPRRVPVVIGSPGVGRHADGKGASEHEGQTPAQRGSPAGQSNDLHRMPPTLLGWPSFVPASRASVRSQPQQEVFLAIKKCSTTVISRAHPSVQPPCEHVQWQKTERRSEEEHGERHKGDADKIRGLGLGADDDIVKSATPAEVVVRVQTVLRRSGRLEAAAAVLDFGRLAIDLTAREVRVDGQAVS